MTSSFIPLRSIGHIGLAFVSLSLLASLLYLDFCAGFQPGRAEPNRLASQYGVRLDAGALPSID